MTDIEAKRQAFATLDSRLAAGEISAEEYEHLRAVLTSGLTADQCARLGVTPPPSPRSISGTKIGPSGGQTRMPTLAELELAPGTVLLGQWRIVRELGRGGFGAVFEAEDIKLERTVAMKVLDPAMVARDELLARFRREVTLMRELSHERIVRVFDYREDISENLALITMEYVAGCSVHGLLALARASKALIPVGLALAIFEQTLEALVAAHTKGVIHRDVTPGNILLAGGAAAGLLADPGSDPRVKLVDFGIAGLVERTELSAKSRILGTAAYVAPEVLDPDAEITPAADVFGAGAVVYELLTGKTPMVTGYCPLGELRDDLPPSLAEVIVAAARPIPGERPSPQGALHGIKGWRAEVKKGPGRTKELEVLHSRISHSVRNENRSALEEACRAVRELLGGEAESDEHLSSGEKWLALWGRDNRKRGEEEESGTRNESAQARHPLVAEGAGRLGRQPPSAGRPLGNLDRAAPVVAPEPVDRSDGQPGLNSLVRWILGAFAGLVIAILGLVVVAALILRDSNPDRTTFVMSPGYEENMARFAQTLASESEASTAGRYWAIAVDEGCKPQGAESSFDVERLMNRAMGSQLEMLAVERGSGRQCWLLVWGHFSSRDAAEKAVDEVPIQYTKAFFRPHAVEVIGSRVVP